jgi:hypothetical protein
VYQGWKDGDYFYNKNRLQEVQTARGMKKVGTEQAGGFLHARLADRHSQR